MYIIAGLGNPGREYENTRHNAGFRAIDALAARCRIELREKGHKGLYGKGMIGSEKVILVKPMTFMNLSGECLRSLMDFYKIPAEQLIVIYDDIDLDPGVIRVRAKGSAGGHNGMKSIINHLGTQEFARVRIGAGAKPPRMDLADYVLGHFPKDEQELMEKAYEDGAGAAFTLVTEGPEKAMNLYNGGAKKEKKAKAGKAESGAKPEKTGESAE